MISLKKRLFQIVVISAAAIAAVVGGAAILFNSLQNKWNYDQTVMHMEAHLSEQQPEIATSYLIPEQSAGRSLLLEKYIKAENLISASILDLLDPIPVEFSHCAKSNSFSNCKSTKGDQIAVIAPISESRTTFGHLLKVSSAKSNGSWIFQIVSTMFVTIALVVAMVLFLLSRVYSRVVFSLNALEEWTRTAVFGKTMDTSEKVDFREIQTLGQNIKRLIDEGSQLKEQAAVAGIAKQVAHDIRAPITALSVIVDTIEGSHLSEENKVTIKNATQRINEIANSLIKRSSESAHIESVTSLKPISLTDAIDVIVREKQSQLLNSNTIAITAEMPNSPILVNANAADLKRVFSNLIDNALESLGKEGEVNICMSKCGSVAKINIVDNGSGIPTHILSKLGQEAITFGRTNGNGLGVIHAFQTIQNLDGKIKFVSQENRGTTVEIQIPISKDYISKESSSTRQVVVIDDDPLIHQAMDLKFSADQSNLDLIHFYSYRDAARWYSKASRISGRLFLVDYDLEPEGPNGLDLIENLGIKAEAVLVTGRHDDPEVLFRADQLGVRVFGKDLLSQIQAENLDLIAGAMNEHS